MNKLKITIASFLLVNSFSFAENLTDFQTKAVKDLYNKGILQTIVKEEDFSKKDSFSRGEIAAIIYNTLSLKNAETVKDISGEDQTVLKALVSDFASELAKMGAKDYELIQKIDETNNNINKRIDNEVATLNKKMDRLVISGDVSFVKPFDTTSDKKELMQNPEAEGKVKATLNFWDNAKGEVGYNFDKEQGEYSLDIKGKEFSLSLFNDDMLSKDDWSNWSKETDYYGDLKRSEKLKNTISSKKLPNFSNKFGIIDKGGINNKDTIVVTKTGEKNEVIGLVTSTDDSDIYGIQYMSKMQSFMGTPGSDAKMNASYIAIDDKATTTADKNFLILGADFQFPITENAKQSFVYNYSKMNSSEKNPTTKSVDYLFPIVSDEAAYLHAKTDINSKKLGKLEFSFGGLNTGYNFDATGLSDSEKQLFGETDLIKLESNRVGSVIVLKNAKGAFENSLSSIRFETNDKTKQDDTVKLGTMYSFKNQKAKLGLSYGDSTEKEDENSTKYKRKFIETELQLKNATANNSSDILKLTFGKEKTTDKDEFKAYLEHKETRTEAKLTLASEYKDVADEKSVKAIMVYEKNGKFGEKYHGNVLLGGRYDNNLDPLPTEKSETYAAFTKVGVIVNENVSLEAGLRYSNRKEDSSGTYTDKGTNGSVQLTYNFSSDIKASLIYGPIDVLSDYSTDIFKYKTDGIYGYEEQNKGSLKISARF